MTQQSQQAAFKNMDKEQRDLYLIKAKQARQAKQLEREANMQRLKTNYLDMPHWEQLSSLYKVRMPMQGVEASAKEIRKALRKCNVSVDKFNEHYTSIAYFTKNNPLWTAQAVTGIVLELKHEQECAFNAVKKG